MKYFSCIGALLLLPYCCRSVMNTLGFPTVTTQLGRIHGTVENIGIEDGYSTNTGPRIRSFYSFKGIPYAKPPVGDLRWKDPLPYGSWMVDLDGTNFGSSCPQLDRTTGRVIGDENCLFLNVFTPQQHGLTPGRSDKSDDIGERQQQQHQQVSSLLPVMVWFHGGGYIRGNSGQFGAQFMMREDVVLVTVNYRLGVLGFLSTGDKNLPGNYAMLDQIESLKWVRDHILNFGGDPGRVTIFGESAGGAITHLLTLSPLATGLFHQAIFQSATALCDWSIERDPLEYAQSIASGLECPNQPTDLLVTCLKDRSVHQLISRQTELLKYSLLPVRCAPVVDATSRDQPFLPQLPLDIIQNRNYKSIPMISGLNQNEGLLFYLWIHYENMAKMSSRSFLERELFPGVIAAMVKNNSHIDAVVNIVRQQYFGDDADFGDSKTFLPRFSQILDDGMFTSCVYTAQLMTARTSTAPLYAYLFSYKGQETPSYAAAFGDLVRRSGFDHPLISTGVTHADELLYLFRMAGFNAAYSPNDMKMSLMMTRLWANFAKTGDPVKGLAHPAGVSLWPRVSPTADGIVYLNIDALDSNLGVDFRKAENRFWTSVVPHVRDMVAAWKEENYTSLSVMWVMLALFTVAILTVAFLVIVIIFKDRRRRYPERGVVLQRTT